MVFKRLKSAASSALFSAVSFGRKTVAPLTRPGRPLGWLEPLGSAASRRATGMARRMTPNPFTVSGMTFNYPPGSTELARSIMEGSYEPDTVRLIARLLADGGCFIDGGAHFGYFSVIAARRVGASGRVFAFEPVPANCSYLERNITANGCGAIVESVKAVLSDAGGSVLVEYDPEVPFAARIRPNGGGPVAAIAEVQAMTLDSFFSTRGWPRCDLVKVDVEGHEEKVLTGMRELAARNPRMLLIVEFSPNLRLPAEWKGLFDAIYALGLDRLEVIDQGRLARVNEYGGVEGLAEKVARRPAPYVNLLCSRVSDWPGSPSRS